MKKEALDKRFQTPLKDLDSEVYEAIKNEERRQANGLELIASENFTSEAILEATGSVFTNKYAEGYPGRRYYGGCEFVDVVERLAIERARSLFGAEHVNVQPHSGSQANMAVYLSVLKPGDTVLGMNLSHGGHLTHGHPLNFSGKYYKIVPYGVDQETELLDYDQIEQLAHEHKPRLIVVGASAYSRVIDFERIARITRDTGSLLMADIAHISGLIAAQEHPNPIPILISLPARLTRPWGDPEVDSSCAGRSFARISTVLSFPKCKEVRSCTSSRPRPRVSRRPPPRTSGATSSRSSETPGLLADAIAAREFRVVSGGTDTHLNVGRRVLQGNQRSAGGRGARSRRDHGQQEHDPV